MRKDRTVRNLHHMDDFGIPRILMVLIMFLFCLLYEVLTSSLGLAGWGETGLPRVANPRDSEQLVSGPAFQIQTSQS